MKTRVQQIAEYLVETRTLSWENKFDGLNERWPDVTQAEFEAAYAIEKVRFLDEVEKILVGLGNEFLEFEARGIDKDRTAYHESWELYWSMRELDTGQRRN